MNLAARLSGIGPLVIAHRGASADLPEHTLASKALAFGLGADFLEQDLVASRDDQLIVLHDVHLERVSNVVERFPDRARPDGRWYARDFDLAELRTLSLWERMTPERDGCVYPQRYPGRRGSFGIATLSEELEMVASLNRTTGRKVGVYPELKRPAWHHAEGVDLAALALAELERLGLTQRTDPVYLQCFDPAECERVRNVMGSELRLVQLLAANDWQEAEVDYDRLRTDDGLRQIASYADAIGVWLQHLFEIDSAGDPVSSGLAERAHDHGLAVHAFTFRADELPRGFASYEHLLGWFIATLGIDGLFTDFTGRTVDWLARHGPGGSTSI